MASLTGLGTFALAALLIGCGNPTVAACERWQESLRALSCVADDYAMGLSCSEYETFPCDASPYFECLEAATSCSEEGVVSLPEPNACASVQGC